MFRAKPRFTSLSGRKAVLGERARKDIRNNVVNNFSITNEAFDELVLEGELTKFQTKVADNAVTVFFQQQNPLFFSTKHYRNAIPTVYTLLKIPDLIPCFVCGSHVSDFILRGANLMLPGCIRPSQGFAAMGLQNNQIWGIRVQNNPIPFAVGITTLSGRVADSESKGVILEVLHFYGDLLWSEGKETEVAGFTSTRIHELLEPPGTNESQEAPDVQEEDHKDTVSTSVMFRTSKLPVANFQPSTVAEFHAQQQAGSVYIPENKARIEVQDPLPESTAKRIELPSRVTRKIVQDWDAEAINDEEIPAEEGSTTQTDETSEFVKAGLNVVTVRDGEVELEQPNVAPMELSFGVNWQVFSTSDVPQDESNISRGRGKKKRGVEGKSTSGRFAKSSPGTEPQQKFMSPYPSGFVDTVLEHCLLEVLRRNKSIDDQLPVDSAGIYSRSLQILAAGDSESMWACFYRELDGQYDLPEWDYEVFQKVTIKNSSYKNLETFFQKLEKQNLLTIKKQVKNGATSWMCTRINWSHPLLTASPSPVNHAIPKPKPSSQKSAASTNAVKSLCVVMLYKPVALGRNIFIDESTPMQEYYTKSQLEKAVDQYIQAVISGHPTWPEITHHRSLSGPLPEPVAEPPAERPEQVEASSSEDDEDEPLVESTVHQPSDLTVITPVPSTVVPQSRNRPIDEWVRVLYSDETSRLLFLTKVERRVLKSGQGTGSNNPEYTALIRSLTFNKLFDRFLRNGATPVSFLVSPNKTVNDVLNNPAAFDVLSTTEPVSIRIATVKFRGHVTTKVTGLQYFRKLIDPKTLAEQLSKACACSASLGEAEEEKGPTKPVAVFVQGTMKKIVKQFLEKEYAIPPSLIHVE